MIIKETNYADIHFVKENDLGMIIWKGKVTSEEYRSAFNTLLELQKTETISRFISDIRKQVIINPSDRKWFENVAFPNGIKGGLKVSAVVFDGNAFKKYYMNLIIKATNRFGIPLRLFNTMEDAMDFVVNYDLNSNKKAG